ncbi:unnamed protein product [Spodoptera exigua]|nr:unnamed protein product [Spodoptera exigua]
MKVLVVLSVFLVLTTAVPLTKDELAILEAFDYDAIFAKEENRKIVFDCLLNKGDCGDYKQIVGLRTVRTPPDKTWGSRTTGPQPTRPTIATVDAAREALAQLSSVTIKMRSWLLCLCVLTVVVSCYSQANRYENFNPDAIVQNDRILLAYYKCVMDKGPCTRDGKNFKRVLPETLATACGRCNPKQKTIVRKLLLGIRSKSEPRFLELLDKYNPDRSNRDALYAFLVTGA